MSDDAEQLALEMIGKNLNERILIARRFLLDARLSEQYIALASNEGSQNAQLERIAYLNKKIKKCY